MDRESLAKEIYLALLANPERYKYITKLYKSGVPNEELNLKNANKAFKLADTFLTVAMRKRDVKGRA